MKRFAAELQLRITAIDWCRVESELDQFGAAIMGPLLTTEECTALAALYPRPGVFRSRVVMARHGFGRGEYQYFAKPSPEPIQALRQDLYGEHVFRCRRRSCSRHPTATSPAASSC